MKKLLFLAQVVLLSFRVFSADLYIEGSFDGWNIVMDLLTDSAKKSGITLIDCNTLDFKRDFEWGMSDEERIKLLEAEIEELKSQKDVLSGISIFSYDGKKSPDDIIQKNKNEIEKLKVKIGCKVNPDDCYPLLTVNKRGDFEGYYNISISLRLSKDSDPYNAEDLSILASRLNVSENEFLVAYIEAFFPLLEDSTPFQTPYIIDTRSIGSDITHNQSAPVTVAPKDDYSFILRRGNEVVSYSPTWEVKSNITSKLPDSGNTASWVPCAWDGKNVRFGKLDNPNVYVMDSNNLVKSEQHYKYPAIKDSINDYRFFSTGNPAVISKNLREGDITLYFPQKDETVKSLLLFTRSWENVFLGPDETVWVCGSSGTVYILTTDGVLRKIIHMPLSTGKLFGVIEDGTFITISEKGISRHQNNGHIMWTIPVEGGLNSFSRLAGERNGIYYILQLNNWTLTRIAEADAPIPPVLAVIRDNQDKLQNGTLNERAQAYLSIADAYFDVESCNSALSYYKKYLELSPADSKTTEKKLSCEVILGKNDAKEKINNALNLLDEYGEETAKPEYQAAMKILEKLRKQVPWDMDVQEMYAELKNAFSNGDEVVQVKKMTLEVTEVDLTSLFPALLTAYVTNPSGYIEVKNISEGSIKNISLTSNIRKFMDFPSKSDEIHELKSGETTLIPIKTVLNQSVLTLTEATPVQIQLTLKWEADDKVYSTQITRPVTIYKSSALTWADTAMAACFVQPNDFMVTDFISKALSCSLNSVLSTNITKAIQIADALGSIPLTYMSDPVTPATQVIDNKYAIDTIRLPSETLQLKGGDCDDMTTLFCSLLEGTGINSAFITIPGHIFAAFDTGIKYNPILKNIDEDHFIFEVEGNAWIPVECTNLSEGFEKAWETASENIGKDTFEVTTVSEAWQTYASIPVQSSTNTVSLDTEAVKKLNSINRLAVIKMFNEAFDKIDYKRISIKEMNSLAKVYHLNGNNEKAIEILNYAITQDPDYQKGYVNLTTLYEEIGDTNQATAFRQMAGNFAGVREEKTSAATRASNQEISGERWAE